MTQLMDNGGSPDRPTNQSGEALLSADDLRRLTALKDQLGTAALSVELGIDEKRLLFARWLADRGIISEEA